MLKPQDIVVLIYLYALERGEGGQSLSGWTFQSIANATGLSKSSIHRSIKNAMESELITAKKINRRRFIDFLIYGVPVVFPTKQGANDIGTPTTLTANVFSSKYQLVAQTPSVWPNPKGQVKGISVPPLHISAVELAEKNEYIHKMLAAIDGLRVGNARERALAVEYIKSQEEKL